MKVEKEGFELGNPECRAVMPRIPQPHSDCSMSALGPTSNQHGFPTALSPKDEQVGRNKGHVTRQHLY